MTLSLEATRDDQRDLSHWLRAFPAFASIERLWLEPDGARCRLAGVPAEIDLALRAEGGSLIVEFEKARAKVIGSIPLPEGAWLWKVRELVTAAALVAPPPVSLALTGRELRVSVAGVEVTGVHVLKERLLIVAAA